MRKLKDVWENLQQFNYVVMAIRLTVVIWTPILLIWLLPSPINIIAVTIFWMWVFLKVTK